jgi:hypothetical protein
MYNWIAAGAEVQAACGVDCPQAKSVRKELKGKIAGENINCISKNTGIKKNQVLCALCYMMDVYEDDDGKIILIDTACRSL